MKLLFLTQKDNSFFHFCCWGLFLAVAFFEETFFLEDGTGFLATGGAGAGFDGVRGGPSIVGVGVIDENWLSGTFLGDKFADGPLGRK